MESGEPMRASSETVEGSARFTEFSDIAPQELTASLGGHATRIRVSAGAVAVDLESGQEARWKVGYAFAVFVSHCALEGAVSGGEVAGLRFSRFFPELPVGEEMETVMVPLFEGETPAFVRRDGRAASHVTVEGVQDYAVGGFRYQWFEMRGRDCGEGEIVGVAARDGFSLGHRGLGNGGKDYGFVMQRLQGITTPPRVPVEENSLLAYRLAYARIDGVELDVQLTSDGVPVISHNFTVKLPALGDVPVAALTSAQFCGQEVRGSTRDDACLDALKRGRVSPPRISEGARPTFAAVLREAPPGKTVNVEIKYPSKNAPVWSQGYFTRASVVETVLRCIEQHARQGVNIVFSSFDPFVCVLLRNSQLQAPVFLLNYGRGQLDSEPDEPNYLPCCNRFEDACRFAQQQRLHGMVTWSEMLRENPELAGEATRRGLSLAAWGTVPGERLVDELHRIGVRTLIYDLVLHK